MVWAHRSARIFSPRRISGRASTPCSASSKVTISRCGLHLGYRARLPDLRHQRAGTGEPVPDSRHQKPSSQAAISERYLTALSDDRIRALLQPASSDCSTSVYGILGIWSTELHHRRLQ